MNEVGQKILATIEQILFRLALDRRERMIQPEFDSQLSIEIDALITLLDHKTAPSRGIH